MMHAFVGSFFAVFRAVKPAVQQDATIFSQLPDHFYISDGISLT